MPSAQLLSSRHCWQVPFTQTSPCSAQCSSFSHFGYLGPQPEANASASSPANRIVGLGACMNPRLFKAEFPVKISYGLERILENQKPARLSFPRDVVDEHIWLRRALGAGIQHLGGVA